MSVIQRRPSPSPARQCPRIPAASTSRTRATLSCMAKTRISGPRACLPDAPRDRRFVPGGEFDGLGTGVRFRTSDRPAAREFAPLAQAWRGRQAVSTDAPGAACGVFEGAPAACAAELLRRSWGIPSPARQLHLSRSSSDDVLPRGRSRMWPIAEARWPCAPSGSGSPLRMYRNRHAHEQTAGRHRLARRRSKQALLSSP